MRDCGVGIDECLTVMRVAVEREQAARFASAIGKLIIEILAGRIAVDFDGDAACLSFLEHAIPICDYSRSRVRHAATRMGENVHAWRADRGEHAIRLIIDDTQLRM